MTSMTSVYPTPDHRASAPMIGGAVDLSHLAQPSATNLGSALNLGSNVPQGQGNSLGSMLGGSNNGHQSMMNLDLANFQQQATISQETSATRFFLEWLYIQETPQYKDQFNRNYIPSQQTEGATLDLAEDILRARGVPDVGVLAGHASRLISLNMTNDPNNRVFIPNGWGTKRLKFLMLVREENIQFNKRKMTYINGFSDHHGISMLSGAANIDEKMVFYINSMVTLAEEKHQMPGNPTPTTMWNVVQATQLVDGQLVGMDVSGQHMRNVSLLRPSDLVTGFANISTHDTGVSNWLTIDGSVSNAGGVTSQFNNMSNNLPTSYLGRLLTPILGSMEGVGGRPGIGGMASSMASIANRNEFSLDNSAFLRFMSRSTGVPLTSRFTTEMLAKLDPTIGQRIKVFPIAQADYSNINAMSMDSTPWNHASIETEIATKLTSTIPSLMWECFAQCASFSFTNATPNHIPLMGWDFLQFITPTGLPGFQNKLENHIKNIILKDITRNDLFVVAVRVFVDVSGEIRLSISYEGGPELHYTAPAFSAGILNPIHTSNQEVANGVITGFGRIVDTLDACRSTEINSGSQAVNLSGYNVMF